MKENEATGGKNTVYGCLCFPLLIIFKALEFTL